jgi:DivIVA domain-containing protein
VDQRSVQQIRNATFAHAVRGYDRNEVDSFLAELADWLDDRGGDPSSELVRAELERIGEQTANILTEAHDAAETIRADAEREVRQKLIDANLRSESLQGEAETYADQAREEADAYVRKTRAGADSYAEKTRSEADSYAKSARKEADGAMQEARTAAERDAKRVVDEATRRRRDIEAVISDLEERRDAVLSELEKLASGLAGTATEHRGGAQPTDEQSPGDGRQASRPRTPQKSQ